MNFYINRRIAVTSVLFLLFFTVYGSETILGTINNPACKTGILSKMGGNVRADLLFENYDVDGDGIDELIYASTVQLEYLSINVLKFDDKKEVYSKYSGFEPPNMNLSSIQLIDLTMTQKRKFVLSPLMAMCIFMI